MNSNFKNNIFEGSGYTSHFWTDGINAASNLVKIWSWTTQNVHNYGYLKQNFINGAANNRVFLYLNSSNLYELDDNPVSPLIGGAVSAGVTGYICEAQGKLKRIL